MKTSTTTRCSYLFAAVLAIALAVAANATAQTQAFDWTNAGFQPNNFDRPDNWSPNGVPGVGNVAQFNAVGSTDLRVITPNLRTGALAIVGNANVRITRPQSLRANNTDSNTSIEVSGDNPRLQLGPGAFPGINNNTLFAESISIGRGRRVSIVSGISGSGTLVVTGNGSTLQYERLTIGSFGGTGQLGHKGARNLILNFRPCSLLVFTHPDLPISPVKKTPAKHAKKRETIFHVLSHISRANFFSSGQN